MDFFTLLIIFIIVARIIEGLRKPQQKKPPPPRSRRLPESGDRAALPLPEARRRPERTEEAASDMVPDELWELLTGQKRERPPPPVTRPPEPAPEERRWVTEETVERTPPRVQVRKERDEEAEIDEMLRRQRAEIARRVRKQEPPEIVSLETEPLPEPARHREYHQRADALAVRRRRPARSRRAALGLTDDTGLRRAVLLHEILRRPKGLE